MSLNGTLKSRAAALGLALIITAFATSAAVAWPDGSDAPPATPDEQGRFLPDLVQILPGKLDVFTRGPRGRRRTLLAFSAAAENYGAGPLIIRGSRPSRAFATMRADQIVRRAGAPSITVPNVGTLRFTRGGGHSHWHLVGFMRFELRTVGNRSLGRRDHKVGFCLGDRYDPKPATDWPGEPRSPFFTSQCGKKRPRRLRVTEGISVGYGDVYGPRLEGQYIDITGVPSGRYVLVQRVNPRHRLLDMHADNDVSSVLFKLTHGRRTRARILAWCTSTARCPTAGRHRVRASG